jgi:hypothetical protein
MADVTPRSALRRRAPRLAAALALGLCALLPGGRALSRKIVFPTYRVDMLPSPPGVTEETLQARDGVPVHVLELPGPTGSPVLVHFHNNRETAAHPVWLARAMQGRGFGVLLVEYRGYGDSAGAAPSEDGLYLDAEAALDMLGHRGIGPDRIVLWGTSLGTGVAAEMARRGRGSALVLVTPYTSIPDIAGQVVPEPLARLLVPDHFDTLDKSASIHMPTLVIHGDADEVVPFWMGERISHAIQGAALLRIEGGKHGDLFMRDPERLLGAIAALAAEHR